MSGLIGFLNFAADATEQRVRSAKQRLCRFPWNTWDEWISPDRTLALGRVEIGTFNPQPQPVTSPDGQVVVLLSGELYRTESLRRELEARGYEPQRQDDPELVLHAYLAYGPEFVSRLEGAFHLAILDQGKQELLIANDRFGLRPLYYAQYRDRLVFAPEVKALLIDPDFEKRLDLVAVAEYMRFQYLLGDKTFFHDAFLLPAASLLRYRLPDQKLTLVPYWRFADVAQPDPRMSYEDMIEEAARLFRDAVIMLGGGSENSGLYLSGGLDSRLIAGCLATCRSGFPTISYGDKDSSDVILAKRIASKVGSDHHFFEFKDGRWVLDYVDLHLELTEGSHSWIHSHGMSTLADVRRLLEINLSGFNVDGLLGLGFPVPDEALYHAPDDWAFVSRLFYLCTQEWSWPGLTEAEEYGLYTDPYRARLTNVALESLAHEVQSIEAYTLEGKIECFKIFHRHRRLTQGYVVFNSSHFENRFPGFDYRLFELLSTVPASWRAGRRFQQAVIERIDPRLALIPQAQDGLLFTRRHARRLAHHGVVRIKQRVNRHVAPVFRMPHSLYADYENWLRHELRDWAVDLLLNGRMASRGIFNQDFVESLLNRHFSGRELHTIGKISPIMTFEMMMRTFFD